MYMYVKKIDPALIFKKFIYFFGSKPRNYDRTGLILPANLG